MISEIIFESINNNKIHILDTIDVIKKDNAFLFNKPTGLIDVDEQNLLKIINDYNFKNEEGRHTVYYYVGKYYIYSNDKVLSSLLFNDKDNLLANLYENIELLKSLDVFNGLKDNDKDLDEIVIGVNQQTYSLNFILHLLDKMFYCYLKLTKKNLLFYKIKEIVFNYIKEYMKTNDEDFINTTIQRFFTLKLITYFIENNINPHQDISRNDFLEVFVKSINDKKLINDKTFLISFINDTYFNTLFYIHNTDNNINIDLKSLNIDFYLKILTMIDK